MSWDYERVYDLSGGIERRYTPNNPEFPTDAVYDALNMIYVRDNREPEKMGGVSRLGSTDMGGAVTGVFDYDEGTRLIATAADGKIYEYGGSDFAQATGGSGFNTASDTRWSGGMFYGATTAANLLIISNGINAPQKYTSGAGFSALGGSPPSTGKFGVSFMGRWWLASGDTLFYSKVNDAETWAAPDGGSIQIYRGTGNITGLYVFMGNLLIFKRRNIFRILPTSQLSETAVREVSHVIGTMSHFTVQETTEGIGLFETDSGIAGIIPTSSTGGFYVSNVSERIKGILDRRSRPNQVTAWATYNEDRQEYWLQYGTISTSPTEGIICNTGMGRNKLRYTRHDRANMTAGAMFRSAGEEIQVVGDTNGRVYKMHSGHAWAGNGSYTGRLRTRSHTQGWLGFQKRYGRTYVDFQTNGSYPLTVRVSYGRKDLPAPAGETNTSTAGGVNDGWGVGKWGEALWGGSGERGDYIRPKKVCRGHSQRLEFETTGVNQWFKINGYVMEFRKRGDRIAA